MIGITAPARRTPSVFGEDEQQQKQAEQKKHNLKCRADETKGREHREQRKTRHGARAALEAHESDCRAEQKRGNQVLVEQPVLEEDHRWRHGVDRCDRRGPPAPQSENDQQHIERDHDRDPDRDLEAVRCRSEAGTEPFQSDAEQEVVPRRLRMEVPQTLQQMTLQEHRVDVLPEPVEG